MRRELTPRGFFSADLLGAREKDWGGGSGRVETAFLSIRAAARGTPGQDPSLLEEERLKLRGKQQQHLSPPPLGCWWRPNAAGDGGKKRTLPL